MIQLFLPEFLIHPTKQLPLQIQELGGVGSQTGPRMGAMGVGVFGDWVSVVVVAVVLGFVVCDLGVCSAGLTSGFIRSPDVSMDMPMDSDVFQPPLGRNAAQQVHITQGDAEGKSVIISWVTPEKPGSNKVVYWAENSPIRKKAEGSVVTYKYFNYTSGYIHHCTIKNLEYDTKYFYVVGFGSLTRRFWFTTPPKVGPDVPYTFGLIGDLGQTFDSNKTLTHYEQNPTKGKAVLFLGDLAYADRYPFHDNNRWDAWGRFAERSVAYQPWIWTSGNHELDYAPDIGENEPYKPFLNRYRVPYNPKEGASPLWYSIKRASAHIIVLSSYSSYVKSSPQYKWLEKELQNVNRDLTPWLIVLTHSPMYSSYVHHYMEGESMRVVYESWFVKYKVDIVLAGHVHAYERTERVSNIAYDLENGQCSPILDQDAPVHITIGDGGNSEGLVTEMTEPQPNYSAYREASFGHGILDIKNRTHAHFAWHRNQDAYSVEADSVWLHNRHWIAMTKLAQSAAATGLSSAA